MRGVRPNLKRMELSPTGEALPDSGGDGSGRDEALMEKITQQQASALAELYSRHACSLRRMIGNVIHEESEADDVLQESFLQVWREAFHSSPGLGRPLGWVVTITRRRAIDRVRRRDSYRRAKRRFGEELKAGTQAMPRSATPSDVTQTDLRRFLDDQMRALPTKQRQAVELTYFGGLSQRQVAASTGTPLGTVKTRLALGLNKLAQRLQPLRDKI